MLKHFLGRVQVDNQVKPLPFSKRKAPELIIGSSYFVCFGNNNTYPCTVKKIILEFDSPEVQIEIPMRARSAKGFIDRNGQRCFNWTSSHTVYASEIGSTREEAVINTIA